MKDVSFDLRAGEVVGLTGLVGGVEPETAPDFRSRPYGWWFGRT